jgi:hypothetical protein
MELEDYDKMSAQADINTKLEQGNQMEQQYYLDNQEKGLVELQLEVDSIKDEILHLLKQDKLETKNGKTDWHPVKDPNERTLSDWGVDKIMQIIHFYINKNTLLSNFDDKQIMRLMYKFVIELNDLVLLKYEKLFREITFEECKQIILTRIENKTKMRMFALQIAGKDYDEKKISNDFLLEIEASLEQEIKKIKDLQRKEKIREYGFLIRELETIVFATLNRAWKGEERGSIRRRTSISELIGNTTQSQAQQQQKGGIFSWGRG